MLLRCELLLCSAMCLLTCAAAGAGDVTLKSAKRYAELRERQIVNERIAKQSELAQLNKWLARPIFAPQSTSAFRKQEIAKTKGRVKKLKAWLADDAAGNTDTSPTLKLPLRSDGIGKLERASAEVVQIIGDTEMLVRLKGPGGEPQSILTLVRNVPTAGLVDGGGVSLYGTFEVAGTEQYNTAGGGSNTVTVIEPFDVDAAMKMLKTGK